MYNVKALWEVFPDQEILRAGFARAFLQTLWMMIVVMLPVQLLLWLLLFYSTDF